MNTASSDGAKVTGETGIVKCPILGILDITL